MTERLKTLLFPLREGTTTSKYQVPRKKSYKSRIGDASQMQNTPI
jgi:hypothetical protein